MASSLALRWPGYLTAIVIAAICIWIASRPDANPASKLEPSSHQRRLWDELTSAHLHVVEVCQVRGRDDASSQRLRERFERYQNSTTGFLKILHEDMPNALNANSCSSFAHSDRLATQQSSILAGSLSTIASLAPEDLLPQSTRQSIRKDVVSATSRFSSRVKDMVKALWYKPVEGIKRLLRFEASGGEARSIHGDVGTTLLAVRKCARAVEKMDGGLHKLLQSLKRRISPHADLAAYLATSPKIWELPGAKTGPTCTPEHLEAMRRHYEGAVRLLSE